jgi:CDP-glycerol glycerophosphotransferase
MKIDKRNPRHWLALALFGFNVAGALLLRPILPLRKRRGTEGDVSARHIPPALRTDPLRSEGGNNQPPPSEGRGIEGDAGRRRSNRKLVVLYGHKLNGNLLALYNHWREHARGEFDFVFLTMDKAYHRQLTAEGVQSALATRPGTIKLLTRADALISDHGLHVMSLLVGRTTIKFFDVWHGIPFKGFDADDFRLQHRYDETWVASPLLGELYTERFGFGEKKVAVTGYARTDVLVRQQHNVGAIKHRLGLDGPDVGKIVLFAPTWKQDSSQRSIYPFGTDEHTFLQNLSTLAERTDSTIVLRAHLNSDAATHDTWPRIVQRPFADYPDTEALLLASDILVCDWSSIAFDWLLLNRPTLFLDVEPPFSKGFSLGPEYRFGIVASTLETLLTSLDEFLREPKLYATQYGDQHDRIRRQIYDGYADGKASERCIARLQTRLSSPMNSAKPRRLDY